MNNNICVDPVLLQKLSDKNIAEEYLRRKTYFANKKDHSLSDEMKTLIRAMVNKLSDEDKAIIHLKFWENLSNEEIAERTEKRLSTIERKIKENLAKLKELLIDELHSTDPKREYLKAS